MRILALTLLLTLTYLRAQAQCTGFIVESTGLSGITECDTQDVSITIRNVSTVDIDTFTIQLNCSGSPVVSRTFEGVNVAVGGIHTTTLSVPVSIASGTCNLNPVVTAVCNSIPVRRLGIRTDYTLRRNRATLSIVPPITSTAPLSALAQSVNYSVLIKNTGTDTARRIAPTLNFNPAGSTTLVAASVKYNGLTIPPDLPPDSTVLIEWTGNIANCPTVYHDWNLSLSYQPNCTGNTSNLNVGNSTNTPVTHYVVDDVDITQTANVGEICIAIGNTNRFNVAQNNPKLNFEATLPNWLIWNRTTRPVLRLSSSTVVNPSAVAYNSTSGKLELSFDYNSADLLTGAQICIGGLQPDCLDSTTHTSEEFSIAGINIVPDDRLTTCNYPVYLDGSNTLSRNFLNRLNANSFDFTVCAPPSSTLLSHRAFRLNIGETPPGCTPDTNLLILNDTFRTITQVQIRRDNIDAAYATVYFRNGAFFTSGAPVSIANLLEPVAIRFSINDNDAGVTYICTNVQFNNIEFAGTATQAGYEFVLDLDSLRGGGCGLPAGFKFGTNDRLELIVDYRVLQNTTLQMSHLQTLYTTNLGLPYFDNRTILATPRLLSFQPVQSPITPVPGRRFLCDNRFYGSEFSVRWDNGLAPANPFGCERRPIFSYEMELRRSTLNPFNLDSLNVELNGKAAKIPPSSGTLGVSNLFQTGVLDSVDIIGNTLTITGLEPYNCSASFIDPINWNYNLITTGTLSLEGSPTRFNNSVTQTVNANYPTNLNITNSGLTYTDKQFIWDLNVVSPVAASFHSAATQFFLDIQIDSRITIDSVVDISSPVGCGIGKLSKDATNYYPIVLGNCGAGNTKRYRVYGSTSTCFNTTANANIRFRCNADTTGILIAADNDRPSAPCLIDQTSQVIQTGSSLTIRDTRSTPRAVNFCDRPNVELDIRNVSPNLANKVFMRLPIKDGLRLDDSLITFTPSGFATALPTLTRRVNTPNTGVRMSNDTLIVSVDTIARTMGVAGITAGATLRVAFDLALECDFKSGTNLEGSLNYFQFCSPAGGGIATVFTTHRIYTKQYESTLGLAVTETPNCSGEFNIQASVSVQGISTADTTDAGDLLQITMPIGTSYLAGSSTAAWGEPNVVGSILTWGVPETPYTTSSTANINLTFKTKVGESAAELCRTHTYRGQVYYPQGAACPSGLLCPGGNILLDSAVSNLVIERPNLEVQSLSLTDITSITSGLFINTVLRNTSSKDALTRSSTYKSGTREVVFNSTASPIRAGATGSSAANLPSLLDQLSKTGRLEYVINRTLPLNCLCESDSAVYLFNVSRDTTRVCLRQSATIGVPFTAPAGTSFKWLLPTGFCCISDANIPNPTITPNLTGNFTLYRIARSGGLVTAIHREEVIIANVPLNITADTLRVCNDDSITIADGSFGGASDYGIYDYRWRVNRIPQPAGDTLSSLKRLFSLAGSPYEVILEKLLSVSGCSVFDTVIVQVVPLPNPDLGPNDTTICLNETLTLAPGSFSNYAWQDRSTNPTFIVRVPGKYYVEVTDATGCKGSDTITVAHNPIPTVEVTFKSDTVRSILTFCDGDGAQVLEASTSTPIANYRWFRDGVIIPGATGRTLNAFNPSSSALYTLEVTDLSLAETRCVVSDTARILFNPDPVFNLPDTLTYCAPASPITSPLSGTAGITHRWITPVPDTVFDATITPAVNGFHKLRTTNIVTGCTYDDSVWVIIHPRPAAVINVNPLGTCVGNRTILSANRAGHTVDVRYEWTGADPTVIITTNPSVEVNTEQRYRLITINDRTTCRDTAFFDLKYVNYPVIRGIDANTIFCGPSAVVGNLLPLNLNYEWKRNGLTFSRDRLATLTQSGNYELTATDPIAGCFSKFAFIGTLITPPIVNIKSDETLCETETLRISAFDPTHPRTTSYSWRRINDNVVVDNDFVLDLDFKTHGDYTCYFYEASVRLTNTINCVSRDTIRVCFERTPKANIIQNDTTICVNNPLTLRAEGGKKYEWYSSSLVGTADTFNVPTNATGLFQYALFANNENVCPISKDSISVRILPELRAQIQPNRETIYCEEDTAKFAGFDPSHLGRNVIYTWSLLLAGQPDRVLQAGMNSNFILPYSQSLEPYPLQIELLVKDQFCEFRDTAQVFFQPLNVIEIQQSNIPCLGGLAEIGNKGPLSTSGAIRFAWETGDTTPTIQVPQSRYYYVNITTGNCTYRDSIFVLLRGNAVKNLIDTALCFQPNLSLPDRNTYTFLPPRHQFYLDHPDSISRFILPGGSNNGRTFDVIREGEYLSVLLSVLGPPCGSDSTVYKIREVCPALTFVPDIFTPNGDGLNDYFSVFGYHILNFRMTIYDRWQSVVYKREIDDIADLSTLAEQDWWNGRRFNTGSPVSVGTYEWVISFEDRTKAKPLRSLRGYLILER